MFMPIENLIENSIFKDQFEFLNKTIKDLRFENEMLKNQLKALQTCKTCYYSGDYYNGLNYYCNLEEKIDFETECKKLG